jgi:hypothetical protein
MKTVIRVTAMIMTISCCCSCLLLRLFSLLSVTVIPSLSPRWSPYAGVMIHAFPFCCENEKEREKKELPIGTSRTCCMSLVRVCDRGIWMISKRREVDVRRRWWLWTWCVRASASRVTLPHSLVQAAVQAVGRSLVVVMWLRHTLTALTPASKSDTHVNGQEGSRHEISKMMKKQEKKRKNF